MKLLVNKLVVTDCMSRVSPAPPRVEKPTVKSIQTGTILMELKRASEKNGPISHYHVIVVPSRSGSAKMPSDYTLEEVSHVSVL